MIPPFIDFFSKNAVNDLPPVAFEANQPQVSSEIEMAFTNLMACLREIDRWRIRCVSGVISPMPLGGRTGHILDFSWFDAIMTSVTG